MIGNLLKREQIEACAMDIVGNFAKSYSPQYDSDQKKSLGGKASQKKVGKKLARAYQNACQQFADAINALNLGVLGRARLCKTIQTKLLGLDYTEDTILLLVGRLSDIR